MRFPVKYVVFRTQFRKHTKQNELCLLTFESTSPQTQRAKRAAPIGPRICKSISIASEASCPHWALNLRIHKHSKRSELCSVTFQYANPQVLRAKRVVPMNPGICKSTSTATKALVVLVVLHIEGSIGTARFGRYACRFADTMVHGHSSFRSQYLWISRFQSQWTQLASLAVSWTCGFEGQWAQLASLAVNVDL